MKIIEEEIRPDKIFKKYLSLAETDINTFFNNCKTDKINCPACGSQHSEVWLIKNNFRYVICNSCKSIFVNPRPKIEYFNRYYKDAPSTKFWATTFYKKTEKARREKLWKPKAKLVKNLILKYQSKVNNFSLVDIGGGYGTFDEEIDKIMDIDITIIEPSIHLSKVCRKKGFKVVEKFFENLKREDLSNNPKCFVSFELFEHLHDPRYFINSLFEIMNNGDMLIFTTLSGMGLDIQLLKENSKSVSPPHHLNFLNPKSVSNMLTEVGFSVLEITTPGKLDIDIISKNKSDIKDNFWRNIIEYSNQDELDKLQEKIVELNLSSHMMMTAIK
tara:strand:- start:44 stop:1033 length:990 start_codon:yes stop_codon:yes gene_type:complete